MYTIIDDEPAHVEIGDCNMNRMLDNETYGDGMHCENWWDGLGCSFCSDFSNGEASEYGDDIFHARLLWRKKRSEYLASVMNLPPGVYLIVPTYHHIPA